MRAYVVSDDPRWDGLSVEIPAPYLLGREPPPTLVLRIRATSPGGEATEVLLRCRRIDHLGEQAFYRPDPDEPEDRDEADAGAVETRGAAEVSVWTEPPTP